MKGEEKGKARQHLFVFAEPRQTQNFQYAKYNLVSSCLCDSDFHQIIFN